VAVAYEYGKLSRAMAYKLAMARATRRWTLKESAQRCGCSISTIWNLENGQRVPSVALAGDIARAYSLSQEDTITLMSEAVTNAGRSKPGRRTKAAA
jgi:transcriptional regulator with XRE-family HTH domain